MADLNANASTPRKPRRGLRIIAWIAGMLVILMVAAYFVATSSAFFKGVILPKVSQALNAQVTVADASISPFSQVVLRDLKVQTTGSEPLVSAPEVRLRYSLMDIIGGRINVEEVTLSAPVVALVQNSDGSSNLDPILQAQKKPAAEPTKPSTPSKPLRVNVKKIALTDATIRTVKMHKGNNRDTTELTHMNLTISNLQNGETAKLALTADIKMENNPPSPATNGLLQAKIDGNFSLALTTDLKPGTVQGNARLEVTRAEGGLAQAASLSAQFDCEVLVTEIKQVALRFQKANTPLGEVRASGPFNMEKTEGRVTVQILNIDKNLLNIAGAASGLDFGPTTLNSTNTVQLANSGNTISASGQLDLRQFQLTRTNQATPPLNLGASYDLSVDRATSTATVRALTIHGTQKGNALLHGELTSPMTVSWGNTAGTVGDSALNFAITHLDLADWKAFAGDFAPAGDLNLKLQLLSQQAGKLLTFDLSSDLSNLTAGSGSNRITQANVTLHLKGKASDLKQFELSDYKFTLAGQNQPFVSVSGAGTYDKTSESADLQFKAEVLLARLLQALPRSDLKASSGMVNVAARLTQKQKQQNVTGTFALTDLTAQIGGIAFQSFGLSSDLDIGMSPDQVQIRKMAGKLTQSGNAGGSFEVSGTYGLSNQAAKINAKLSDFNQNGLRPFLEPMLADKKLTSVALSASASVQYDPQSASSVKGDLQVANLVVNDPKGQFPATPLSAKCQLDASLNKKVTDIRTCQLALTPTARATNVISLTGHLDMSQTNATQGNLKLAADSVDLTTYYDLFGGQSKSAAPARSSPAAVSGTSPGNGAMGTDTNQLPFRNFTVEATVHRLYLREVDISEFQFGTKIDGGHVVVSPCKLALNGAPVNTTIDLDMGVPGYKYDLNFGAQAVPLTPLVNSFQPERKGQLGGTFTANAKIKGTGMTGESLQKSLAGQFDLTSTNLNLSIVNIKSPLIKNIINVVATIPDLIKNPESAVGSLLQGLTGQSSGGLTDELAKSPINAISASGNAASGKINLQQAMLMSAAFRADVTGTIALASVLTNSSIRFPVSISLSQPIARRVNLVSADTPTNAPYAKLPEFLTETGTLGEPKAQVNKLTLIGLAAKGIGGALPNVGGTAGNIIQGLSSLGATPAAGTNAPGANTNTVGNLLQGLGNILGGSAAATTVPNTPPTTNPPAAKQPPANPPATKPQKRSGG